MYYYKIEYSSPYCGTDEVDYFALKEPITFEDELDITGKCIENLIEDYSYLINGWNGDDPTEEQLDNFIENCDINIIELTKEEYEEVVL